MLDDHTKRWLEHNARHPTNNDRITATNYPEICPQKRRCDSIFQDVFEDCSFQVGFGEVCIFRAGFGFFKVCRYHRSRAPNPNTKLGTLFRRPHHLRLTPSPHQPIINAFQDGFRGARRFQDGIGNVRYIHRAHARTSSRNPQTILREDPSLASILCISVHSILPIAKNALGSSTST